MLRGGYDRRRVVIDVAGEVVTLWALIGAWMKWCSWELALHRVLHESRDSACRVHIVVGIRVWSVCMSCDCLGPGVKR